MSAIQFLYFQQYKESVDIYGTKLRDNTRIRLDRHSINDESFKYVAIYGHCDEFIRLFQTNACVQISVQAKELALTQILIKEFPEEMVFELLKDGCVDPMAIRSSVGNCLAISASSGYDSTVKLLLQDERVDPSVADDYGHTCLHFAANNVHESTVSLLLEDGRVDPSAINNEGLECLSVTTHPTIRKMLQDERRNRLSIVNVCL
jgi:hypothetical protein